MALDLCMTQAVEIWLQARKPPVADLTHFRCQYDAEQDPPSSIPVWENAFDHPTRAQLEAVLTQAQAAKQRFQRSKIACTRKWKPAKRSTRSTKEL